MLEEILKNDNEYEQIRQAFKKDKAPVFISGCTDTGKWHLTSLLGENGKKNYKIVVVPDEESARQWIDGYPFFGEKVFFLPAKDPLFYSADVHGNAIARERMQCIKKIMEGEGGVYVMTIDAVMDRVVPLCEIQKHKMIWKPGDTAKEENLSKKLVEIGYEKTGFVEAPGEFAIRGGIVDVYPYTGECPYRMEFWGDEIDSIRSFDAESQRSIEEVQSLTIYPATEIV